MADTPILLLVLACAACSVGCNSILGLGDYKVSPEAGSGGQPDGSGSCDWDPSSGGCYPCKPSTDPQYLNACTSAKCVEFDDSKRVTKLLPDGGFPAVPDLPPVEAGPDVTADVADTGVEAGKESGADVAEGGGG